jgi:PqqD family protein of HPr-rel-A system
MGVEEGTRIRRRDDVSMTLSGNEALLVDERSGSVHVVNQTAGRLWELCEGDPTLDQLVAGLAESYGVTASVVRDDVQAMLGTFRDLGIVELIPA